MLFFSQVKEWEIAILETLDYCVTVTTSRTFLTMYLYFENAAAYEDSYKTVDLASYILDATLVNCNSMKYPPSHLAAAAYVIARRTLGYSLWTSVMAELTGFDVLRVICRVALSLVFHMNYTPSALASVQQKYSHAKYEGLASRPLCTSFPSPPRR